MTSLRSPAACEAEPLDRGAGRPVAPAVQVFDAWFAYGKRTPVLQGVSLDVVPGELVMLLGASGGGKTTLLKLMKGLLSPTRGEVRVLGDAVPRSGARRRLHPQVAYIPQQLGLVRSRTVTDNVLAGALGSIPAWRGLTGLFPREVTRSASEKLDLLGIGHKAGERVRSLSGGERQRVAIARALMQQPRIILADEFVSQLDAATTGEVMSVVRDIADRGVAVVTTTHNLDLAQRFGGRVAVLRDGEKVFDGDPSGLSSSTLARMLKP